MSKKILIDASQPTETRIALIKNDKLEDIISYSRSILLLVEKKESGDTKIRRGLPAQHAKWCKK